MFQLSDKQLEALGAKITTREIRQQPELWKETFDYYSHNLERITNYLDHLPKKRYRVIFTGAGTSQYIGDTILPFLKRYGNEEKFEFQAVATTHLVSNPFDYFKKNISTILVSFARSGNSPESLASVTLGNQNVDDFYHICITCSPEGKLAQSTPNDDRNLLLIMPKRANDAGFAMTGSFTCMTLTALLIFDQQHSLLEKENIVQDIIKMGNSVIEREDILKKLLDLDYNRVIYLGSGSLSGLAREVQLKILELTAGTIATIYDSSMGFRHGPKSFINIRSLVFVFVSNDPYTRKYDLDILTELQQDRIAPLICAVGVHVTNQFKGISFDFSPSFSKIPDAYLSLPYAIFGQSIALLSAIKVGNKPDTPSPSGTVNRVVKGVTIHSL